MRMLGTREITKTRKNGNHETDQVVIDTDSIVALFPKRYGTEVVMTNQAATFYSPWTISEWVEWLGHRVTT